MQNPITDFTPHWRQSLLRLTRIITIETRRRCMCIPDRMAAENERDEFKREHSPAMIAATVSQNGKGPTGTDKPVVLTKVSATKPQSTQSLPKLGRLLYLQSGRCFFCGESLAEAHASIEHLNPISRGGTRTEDNEVVCHKTLNHVFGSMGLKDKFEFVLESAGSFKCPKN